MSGVKFACRQDLIWTQNANVSKSYTMFGSIDLMTILNQPAMHSQKRFGKQVYSRTSQRYVGVFRRSSTSITVNCNLSVLIRLLWMLCTTVLKFIYIVWNHGCRQWNMQKSCVGNLGH